MFQRWSCVRGDGLISGADLIREDRSLFCAPVIIIIIMHPMPVCSVSGGDIFDCIQRGNVEQCTNFIQTDRSVLKQKGMVECDMMEKHCFSCSTRGLPLLPGSLFLVAFSFLTAQSLLFRCIDTRNCSIIVAEYWLLL